MCLSLKRETYTSSFTKAAHFENPRWRPHKANVYNYCVVRVCYDVQLCNEATNVITQNPGTGAQPLRTSLLQLRGGRSINKSVMFGASGRRMTSCFHDAAMHIVIMIPKKETPYLL